MFEVNETKLTNDIRVITHKMPVQSAAVGAFVHAGSRHETEENNGVAHFLEHMAFKGTPTRTAYDISQQIEVLGSHANAMTSTESTAYYTKGLSQHVGIEIDIIGDALCNSIYAEADIKLESGVILQEISQYEDDPFSTMQELLTEVSYPNQPVGRKILGTKDFVANAKPDDFRGFVGENYSGETMMFFAAGGMEHDAVVDAVNKAFYKIPAKTERRATVPATYVGGLGIDASKDFSQVSVGISFRSVPVIDNAQYAHMLLGKAFGDGMSSPLFTEVREKRGLVYHTSCHSDFNVDYGNIMIYGGMTPENLNEFIDVACSELAKMCENINFVDVERAKNSVLVSLAFLQENPSNMMYYMANSMFTRGRIRDFDEVRRNIENMTVNDLKNAAKFLLRCKPTIALVGPVPDADYEGMIQSALGLG